MSSLDRFKNKHCGKRCFVLGAGISLPSDISFVNDNDVVISVNSSILVTDWRDKSLVDNRFWVSNDSMCLKWDYFKKVLSSKCTRIYRESWAKHASIFSQQSYSYFWPRTDEMSDDGPLSDSGSLCSISSVPTAIDLAIWMGCNPIYLLGVDHVFQGNKTHFWHFWAQTKWPRMCGRIFDHDKTEQKDVFVKNEHTFEKLNVYASQKGIKIFNCSPISRLTVFEKVDVNELKIQKS